MREVTLGQIAYEAHFQETAGDFENQSAKQQERWQRLAEAVFAAAREREAGIAALVQRLREELEWQREALDCGYYRYPNGQVSCSDCEQEATEQSAIQHTEECAFGRIERALSLTPPAALDDLRRKLIGEESDRWITAIRKIDLGLCDFIDEGDIAARLAEWLEALRRRERFIGAEEELRRITDSANGNADWVSIEYLRRCADAIAAERDHIADVGKKVNHPGIPESSGGAR